MTSIEESLVEWASYIECFGSRDSFFHYLLTAYPDPRDLRFKYVLREYDSFQSKKNLRDGDIDTEHIFPIDPGAIVHNLPAYGFQDTMNLSH